MDRVGITMGGLGLFLYSQHHARDTPPNQYPREKANQLHSPVLLGAVNQHLVTFKRYPPPVPPK
jgi:hypothetical protein